MLAHFYLEVHFLYEFSFKAVARAFSKFKSSTRELGIIITPDQFITDQHLLFFVDQQAIYSYVKPKHLVRLSSDRQTAWCRIIRKIFPDNLQIPLRQVRSARYFY